MKCCTGCVAPKRYPGCHDHCLEYIEERAEYDRRKAVEDKKSAVRNGIYMQKSYGAFRAIRRHGRNRKK